jgi:hypothetical protein
VNVLSGDNVLDGGRPTPFQNGFWTYALCEDCNKITGALYGSEFAAWTRWGMALHDAMNAGSGRVAAHRGYPARIAKQVISTMIASSQAGFADAHPHLRSFVLDRDAKFSASDLRLATYVVGSRTGRSTGQAFVVAPGGLPHILVEISLPPFGYLLTISGDPIDPRPASIGWFAECGYDEERVIEIPELHVLPTHEAIPGDFRTRDEIRFDMVVNMLIEDGHADPTSEARRIFDSGRAREFFVNHREAWDWGFERGLADE